MLDWACGEGAEARPCRSAVACSSHNGHLPTKDTATNEQAERLLERAACLLEDVKDASNHTPDARTARRAHELRQTVGVLLILSERLARQHGNARMVELDARTGRASFVVDLEGTDPLSAN